jgi:hypothetical protein
MGMSKSPQPTDSKPAEIQPAGPVKEPILMHEGIPMEMFNHFNIEMESLTDKDRKQLREVYEMLDGSEKEIGDFLMELRRIENRLGQPAHTETRFGKIWHWAKLQGRIKSMQKQQMAMEVRVNAWE